KLRMYFETWAVDIENFFKSIMIAFGADIPLSVVDTTIDDAALARLDLAKRQWEELMAQLKADAKESPFDNFFKGLDAAGNKKLKFDSGPIEQLNKAIQDMQNDD